MAGEHEVLPDHQAEFVAEIVEPVRLVDTPAPHADHRHARIDGGLKNAAHSVGRASFRQGVDRYPVRTGNEQIVAVDAKAERPSSIVGLGHELELTQADATGDRSAFTLDRQFVNRLRTVPCGPPELRLGNVEGECGLPLCLVRSAGFDPYGCVCINVQTGASQTPLEFDLTATQSGDESCPLDANRSVRFVPLHNAKIIQPRQLISVQLDPTEQADRHQRDIPIPSRIALRTAQQVHVRDAAVPFDVGHGKGQGARTFRSDARRGQEAHVEPVRTSPKGVRNIEIIAHEATLDAADLVSVENDNGDAVHVAHRQRVPSRTVIPVELPRGYPFALMHPIETGFDIAPVGIRDQTFRAKTGVDIERNVRFETFFSFRASDVPTFGKIDVAGHTLERRRDTVLTFSRSGFRSKPRPGPFGTVICPFSMGGTSATRSRYHVRW